MNTQEKLEKIFKKVGFTVAKITKMDKQHCKSSPFCFGFFVEFGTIFIGFTEANDVVIEWHNVEEVMPWLIKDMSKTVSIASIFAGRPNISADCIKIDPLDVKNIWSSIEEILLSINTYLHGISGK